MKTRTFLMVGVLLLTLVLSVSAADIVVTPQNTTLAFGETVDLTVGVQDVDNLGGFDIDLRWDPSVVELDTEAGNVQIGPLFSGHANNSAVSVQNGRVRVAAVNATLGGVSGSADLFTARFRAIDDTGRSTAVSTVVNNYGFLNSTSGDDIPVASITNAAITTQAVNRITATAGAVSSSVPQGASTIAVFTVTNGRGIPTSALTINTTIFAPDGSVFNTSERSGVVLPAYGQDVQQTVWTPAAAGTYTLKVNVTSDTGLPVVGTTTATRTVTARPYNLEFYHYNYNPSRVAVGDLAYMYWYARPSESGNVQVSLSVPEGVKVYDGTNWTQCANKTQWMGGGYWNYIYYQVQASRPGTYPASAFNLTISANGKTASKAAFSDITFWIPSIQVKSVGLVSANTTDTFETTYNTLHTNNTYDNVTTITAQSGARGRTLMGLGYLVHYPYGCVEQTCSQMLASLNVKNYYLERQDRPLDFAVIRDRANSSVQSGVAVLVNEGLRGQHDDGGWSLWGSEYYEESEASSSSYAAYTLARVNASDEDLNRLLTDKISKNATVTPGTVNFDKLVEWFYLNPDDPSSGTWTWSAGVCHAWTPTSNTGFVMLIHDMIRQQGTLSEPYATYMTKNMQNATRYFVQTQSAGGSWGGSDDTAMATALGLWGLHAYGTPSDDVTQEQINTAKEDAAAWLVDNQNGDGSWNADSYYGWYDSGRKSESTAYAILALNATGIPADNPTIQKGVGWLINQYESGGSWGYTWATQAAIDALIHCQPVDVSTGTVDVFIDDTHICTLTVDATNPKDEYTLNAAQMAAMMASGTETRHPVPYSTVKEHQVTVDRTGGTGTILVTVENSQRAPVNEIDATIRDTGTIQMFGSSAPAPGALVLSENMDLLGDAAPQAIFSSVSLTSNPSPLVSNESGALTLRVISGEDVLSPLIEVPIEGFTFANGTITQDGAPVSYEVLNGSVNTDAASIYIEPNHWLSGSTYIYVFDITPTDVGDLDFHLRFRPLYDETNVTLSEKSLTVTGRGDVAVQVINETGAAVPATIVLGDLAPVVKSSHTFTGLLAGSYPLSVSKEGCANVSTTLNVAANDQTNVTVSMPTNLTTPRLILSQGSGMLGGVLETPAGRVSGGYVENATYNMTLVGNGGMMGVALEFPQRYMVSGPVVQLNGAPLASSDYDLRGGTFTYSGVGAYSTTNASLVVYNSTDGVNYLEIDLEGLKYGDANKDGRITPFDARGILRATLYPAELGIFDYADVNRDGRITSFDARQIHRYYLDPQNNDY
jgi:hypothetical protein